MRPCSVLHYSAGKKKKLRFQIAFDSSDDVKRDDHDVMG